MLRPSVVVIAVVIALCAAICLYRSHTPTTQVRPRLPQKTARTLLPRPGPPSAPSNIGHVIAVRGGQIPDVNLQTGQSSTLIPPALFPQDLAGFDSVLPSADGDYLAFVVGWPAWRFRIWQRATGRFIEPVPGQTPDDRVEWLPGGRFVLLHDDTGGWLPDRPYPGSVAFVNAATGKTRRLPTVNQLLLAVPSGRGDGAIEVVLTRRGGSEVFFQPMSGKRRLLFRWKRPLNAIAQSPDASHTIFHDVQGYHIVDGRGRRVGSFRIPVEHENFNTYFRFNAAGTKVAVFAEYNTGEPHVNSTQLLWVADVKTGRAREIATWYELFQGADLAIFRRLEGWASDGSSIVISGELWYGLEKPADTEHDWHRVWVYDTSVPAPRGRQVYDSGKGCARIAWYPGRP